MPLDKSEIKILANAEEINQTSALEFTRQTIEEVRLKGFLTVALSGGSTPKGLYSLIASDGSSGFRLRVPWNKIHFFWGDERHVPPDHAESNYRIVYEAMLSKVPVPPENVHRIKAENPDAGKAAEDYERVLREFFRLKAEQLPRFDMVLLGMGADGHTASLFPRTEVIREEQRLVAAPWIERLNTYRITLTPPVFNNARRVIFLVSGENKADALLAVLRGGYQPERFPAQIIRPTNGKLLWLVDQDAARLLELNEGNNIKPE
jgi:6-phosphogluconolactonase